MNQTVKKLLWPLVLIRHKYDDYLRRTNPEKLFSTYYKRATGRYLDINNPQTLDDKIAYMEFRTDTTEWSRLADKVRVREYVEECGFGENLTRLYGVWEKGADVDFDSLPKAFVIKTNNGSATNILVKDKSKADIEAIRKQLDKWLAIDYGYQTAQPHYSHMKPLILAEEFLVDEETQKAGKVLNDYKFYCVNGKPMYVQVMCDRVPNTHEMKLQLYDMDWKARPEYLSKVHEIVKEEIPAPISFMLMKGMAAKLSSSFPFVRVDFYEINGKPIFGEMTFTPGFDTITMEFRQMLGKKIKLKRN